MNRIKEYLEYKKNKRIVKRELTKLAITSISTIKSVSEKSSEILNFINKIVTETKNIQGEKLIEIDLSEVSNILQTDNNRLIQVFTYIAGLQPEDIQKILVHSVVATMPETKNNK